MGEYHKYLKQANLSRSSIGGYKSDISKFLDYLKKSNIKIQDINETVVNSYIFQISRDNMKSATLNRMKSSIKKFLYFLFEKKYLNEDFSKLRIKSNRVEKKIPEILTVEEINRLLNAPDKSDTGYRDKAMLELLYSTGIKVNEVINLKVGDVDLKLKTVTCKSDKSSRILPIGAMAFSALMNYLELSRPHYIRNSNEYLFLNCYGNKISRQSFWKIIKKYTKLSGIEKNISITTLRHSFTYHMIENGIEKNKLNEVLGNSNVQSLQMFLDLNRQRVEMK